MTRYYVNELNEGNYDFRIVDAKFSEVTNKCMFDLVNRNGDCYPLKVYLKKKDGKENHSAIRFVLVLIRSALKDNNILSFDTEKLLLVIGKCINADIKKISRLKEDGRQITVVKVENIKPAYWFEE